MGLECAREGGSFRLSASWNRVGGVRYVWQWRQGDRTVDLGDSGYVSGASLGGMEEAGEYSVRVLAYYPGREVRKYSAWVTATAECSADALAAPSGVSAVCGSDGVLAVSWGHRGPLVPLGLQFEVEVDGTVVDEITYQSRPGAVESYVFRWEQAQSNRAHRVRVRVAPSPAGVELGEDRESPWSDLAAASKCAVFKPSGFTTATCNSHGVVHLEWDPVGGADRYDLKNTAPGEESVNYEGPATEVYAQRWEGETYKIRIRARAQTGQQWSGWTEPQRVECNPLDPKQIEHPESAEGRSVSWTSPNAVFVNPRGPEKRHWHNPVHVRYMKDVTKNPKLGRDNCTAAQRKQNGSGWTRTCTVYWTEPLAIALEQDVVRQLEGHTSSHRIPIIHNESVAHLYANSDGSASVAPHRHCDKDHDGDGTIDGTCPGPDLAHAPDLRWHTPLPGPEDSWWKKAAESQVIGGGAGSGGGAIVGAALGSVPGAIAGFVIGGAAGTFIAWLHSKDNKVNLVINGRSGCLLDLWQEREHAVEETFEVGSYETRINHVITYCDKGSS